MWAAWAGYALDALMAFRRLYSVARAIDEALLAKEIAKPLNMVMLFFSNGVYVCACVFLVWGMRAFDGILGDVHGGAHHRRRCSRTA